MRRSLTHVSLSNCSSLLSVCFSNDYNCAGVFCGYQMLQSKIIKLVHNKLDRVYAKHRCLGNTSKKGEAVGHGSYTLIYQLPVVPTVALISRMKVYQTALATSASAVSLVLDQMNVINTSTFHIVVSLGFSLCVPFYTLGIFSNRVVGKMYLSDDKRTLKVGYINFWGRRENALIDVEDIVPFSEMKTKANDLYFNLEQYSSNKKFKLSHSYGKIENLELFSKVFGENKK